jgi:hypothetical protein
VSRPRTVSDEHLLSAASASVNDGPCRPIAADALVAMWNGTLLAWSLDPAGALGDRLDAALGHLMAAWADTTEARA